MLKSKIIRNALPIWCVFLLALSLASTYSLWAYAMENWYVVGDQPGYNMFLIFPILIAVTALLTLFSREYYWSIIVVLIVSSLYSILWMHAMIYWIGEYSIDTDVIQQIIHLTRRLIGEWENALAVAITYFTGQLIPKQVQKADYDSLSSTFD